MLEPNIQLGNKPPIFKKYFKIGSLFIFIFIQSCGGNSTPTGIVPITNFDLTRYLGTWYEIARFDHSFERGLGEVTATYTTNKDGSVKVENSGTNEEGKRETKIGKAKFVGDPKTGHLKVSFFRPFYGSYVIFYLEDNYQMVLVTGDTRKYCWILSRTPNISEEDKKKYIEILKEKGFDTDNLIFPKPYQGSKKAE